VLAKLKSEFEPRGVVFLSIHTPGESDQTIRRSLEFRKVPLLFAVDQDRHADDNDPAGVTADRYRIRGFPSMFLIDRAGEIGLSTRQGIQTFEVVEERDIIPCWSDRPTPASRSTWSIGSVALVIAHLAIQDLCCVRGQTAARDQDAMS